MPEFYANCPKGLEQLLQKEIVDCGGDFISETVGGIRFEADLKTAYRICLWSRIANKVVLILSTERVNQVDDIHRQSNAINWENYIRPNGSLWVDFQGTNKFVRDSQFGAKKIKDGIVDRLRQQFGVRPDVDKIKPQLIINAKLSKGQLIIALDLCGESLHRRGYRQKQGAAPLKENLAAGILYRSNWPALAKQGAALTAKLQHLACKGSPNPSAASLKSDKSSLTW